MSYRKGKAIVQNAWEARYVKMSVLSSNAHVTYALALAVAERQILFSHGR